MSPKTNSEEKKTDKPYRSTLGSIMRGQFATHPDLSFFIPLLARSHMHWQSNPGINHWNVLMHIIESRYIKNTLRVDHGLTYSRESDLFSTTFVDADCGDSECKDTYRDRSTSEYIFTMTGGADSDIRHRYIHQFTKPLPSPRDHYHRFLTALNAH
jgi:hypothetical protein